MLYLGGLRWWPGVLLGELLSGEFAQVGLGPAFAELASANTARALVAVLILQRLVGRRAAMDRLEQVGAVLVAVAVGEALERDRRDARPAGRRASSRCPRWGCSGGAGGWAASRAGWSSFRSPWPGPTHVGRLWRGRRAVDAALMLAAVAGLSVIALSADQPLTYIVFPAFIWAALRLGPQGATLAVAVAAVIAVLATSNQLGPFVEHSPTDSALNLQLYIIFAALTTLCLAAIVSERLPQDAGAGRVAAPRG